MQVHGRKHRYLDAARLTATAAQLHDLTVHAANSQKACRGMNGICSFCAEQRHWAASSCNDLMDDQVYIA